MFKHFMLDFGLYFVGLVILLIVISNCWQRYTKKRKFSAPTLDTLGLTGLTARAGERQSKESRPADFPWYYVWGFFFAVCLFFVAAGWLIVTWTGGGWSNIWWVLLPSGLFLVIFCAVRLKTADIKAKREALAVFGFEPPSDEEAKHIAQAIRSMFQPGGTREAQGISVDSVLASATIEQNVRCYVADASRAVVVHGESGDFTRYVPFTVCLLEHDKFDTHWFRLKPHNSIIKTLIRRLTFWQRSSGFDDWYDAVEIVDDRDAECLTPDLRNWLGRHSCWSKSSPWTLVGHDRRIMAYRERTRYEAAQYPVLLSEMQTLAEAWGPDKSITDAKNREFPHALAPVKVTLLQDLAQPPEDVQYLISQSPPRYLSSYWKKRTRVRPFKVIIAFIFAVVAIFLWAAERMHEEIRKISIEVDMIVYSVVALVVLSGLAYLLLLKYVRRPLCSYWKKSTTEWSWRMIIGFLVAVVLMGVFFAKVGPGVISKMSIEMRIIAYSSVALVLLSGLTYEMFLQYLRCPQSARRLLESGKLAYGHVIRLSKVGKEEDDPVECMIEVQFEVDNIQQNAQCRLFVIPGNFDDALSLANSDEKVAILYDELSPNRITIPQFIAFGR
jgi:hypothetical protein